MTEPLPPIEESIPQSIEQPLPRKKNKSLIFGILFLGFLLIGLASFSYWYLILRFEESTEDAYVQGNQIVITPQIVGHIETLHVDETEVVQEGTLLVTLDSTDQVLAFEAAKHSLANVVREVIGLFERVEQLKAEKQMREIEKFRTYQDYTSRKDLLNNGAVAIEQFQHAEASYFSSIYALTAVEHQLQAAMAEIENTNLNTHPKILEAKDQIYKNFLNLQRCQIRAPTHGVIAQRQAQIGEAVHPGSALMFLIPLDQIWINANFKENQLKNIRIGQEASMVSDAYGNDVVFHGKVIGFWPGTGSVFSLIPPQNATGNWIKIVQRLPVRISVNPEELKHYPLQLGLSMNVTLNIQNQEGERMPLSTKSTELFKTTIFQNQLKGVDEIIAQVIRENSLSSHKQPQ